MYLKMLKTFMFKHDYLNYCTVYIYKICSEFSRIEIRQILSEDSGSKGHILVMGMKKHLLITDYELSNYVLYRLFIKSSFIKSSLESFEVEKDCLPNF